MQPVERPFTHWAAAVLCLMLTTSLIALPGKIVYKTSVGTIHFISDAPLEIIEANSKELRGLVDTSNHTFAFSVEIASFSGFNSPLQRQHFYENYMESSRYPQATFSGKIIELINFAEPGNYVVRAKGLLNIHGVKVERIIKSTLEITGKEMKISSTFMVSLQDHNIKVPRIVNQKIAPDIKVTIHAVLKPVQI